ncbi:MAG: ZIP family metal transporter [Acidobacteria bacterium]|nr:ZIP family metal transporter [Acidobacteriota bacterium]
MTTEAIYALGSVCLVSLFSLVGILFFFLQPRALSYMVVLLVSFSSGSLFGDAFIHLLPETVAENGFTLAVSLFTLSGIAASFFVEKIIHWRHVHSPTHSQPESFAYMNLLGDAAHNFIDGVVIGAAYLLSVRVGIATTVAVLLHEIPQEMGDFGVLVHGGFTRKRALLYNFATAAIAMLGTLLTILLVDVAQDVRTFLVPFAAGGFIYIAGADLIPQMHKEKDVRGSLLQLLFFTAGILVMVVLTAL